MKKILSLVLAMMMVLSCAAFVSAADAATDASNEDYAIEFLRTYGIFKGTSTDKFAPDAEDLIERWQMALFVARMSTGWVKDTDWEANSFTNSSTFEDIYTGLTIKYMGAISYAAEKGIIEGYSPKVFAPHDGIIYQDALTMVVRTLGYQGLSYPWGYIQKAVELGLTEDVEGAQYTKEMTRGQVAMVIYNALFAETKSGETLAKSIFGVDFGWENIMIVSTDSYALSNEKVAVAGYIGFKVIGADGKLSAKTYYVTEKEMGLNKNHDAELAVGTPYCAMFKINDNGLVSMETDPVSLLMNISGKPAIYLNDGHTNNEAVKYGTKPIAGAISGYTQVSDLTKYGDEWLANMYKLERVQLAIYGLTTVKALDPNSYGYNIGVDANGNIVELKDGSWEIVWYYHPTLKNYYRDQVTGNTIYRDWMTEEEFLVWYEATADMIETSISIDAYKWQKIDGKYPYAKLALYDLDADNYADYGMYKAYQFGKISSGSSATCSICGSKKDHWNFGSTAVCKAHHWLNVDASVTNFAYDGYAVYSYNKTSGELNIVKHFNATKSDDKDSYIKYGIIDQYSAATGTFYLNGEKMTVGYPEALTGVDSLNGGVFYQPTKDAAHKKAFGIKMDALLNQYVEVVVLDGYVIDVNVQGAASNVFMVVGYAGFTADGCYMVYGYDSANGFATLSTIKVNCFNGWKKGDYKWNFDAIAEDGAFDLGTVYTLTSKDPNTNSYAVSTTTVEDVMAAGSVKEFTFEGNYRIETSYTYDAVTGRYVPSAPVAKAMAAGDKYLIITARGLYYYTGIVPTTWASTYGYAAAGFYKSIGGVHVFFISPEDNHGYGFGYVEGFDTNAHDIGFVLYEADESYVQDAAYDSAIGGTDYILGSTKSTAYVRNLLTGGFEFKTFQNIDLVEGCVYMTIGNHIIERAHDAYRYHVEDKEFNDDCAYFIYGIMSNFYDDHYETAKYLVETFVATKSQLNSYRYMAELFGLVDGSNSELIEDALARAAINGDGNVSKVASFYDVISNPTRKSCGVDIDNASLADGKYYYGVAIRGANGKIAVYIFDSEAIPASKNLTFKEVNDEADYDVAIKGSATGTYTKAESTLCNNPGDILSATLTGFTLELNIAADGHDEAAAAGIAFGKEVAGAKANYPWADSEVIYDDDYVVANADALDLNNMKVVKATCDNNCGLLTKVTVSNLDIAFEYDEDEEIWITETFLVCVDANDDDNGNHIDFEVYFTVDASAKLTMVVESATNHTYYAINLNK